MIIAIVLILVTVGTIVFHFMSPWWWTPIASNWGYIDDTIIITFWVDENLPNPSYVLANANAVLDYGKFSVGVFVRNIADEEAHLSLFQGFQSDNRVTPSSPRTIGASFTLNFGR